MSIYTSFEGRAPAASDHDAREKKHICSSLRSFYFCTGLNLQFFFWQIAFTISKFFLNVLKAEVLEEKKRTVVY